ncbi:hypothetical protein EON63_10720 [archaeon]|nr:MAG: hypothetical protein EON63_10720 [archaeon]
MTPSPKFNLLQLQVNNVNITTVRGDGLLLHRGEIEVEGGMRIGMVEGGNRSANVSDPCTTYTYTYTHTHHMYSYPYPYTRYT